MTTIQSRSSGLHLFTGAAALALTLILTACGGGGGGGGSSSVPVVPNPSIPVVTNPNVIFVNDDATGLNDGSSWTDAFTTLQAAMATAQPGKQVWVAEGIYRPASATATVLDMAVEADVYGGFAGTENALTERSDPLPASILSGDFNGDDPAVLSDNSYHVVVVNAAGRRLDGFTISGGNAAGPDPGDTWGGGMVKNAPDLTIANIIFSGNNGIDGGGMRSNSGSSTLINVTFTGNTGVRGGGMNNAAFSTPTLIDVAFIGNTATETGGGISNTLGSAPTLINVVFDGNTTGGSGGGMYTGGVVRVSLILTNVTFVNNMADGGGGLYNENSDVALTNVSFDTNTATNDGGGIVDLNSTSTLTNVSFSGNTAGRFGGGMYSDPGPQTSPPTLTNTVFWGNTAPFGFPDFQFGGRSPNINNSCAQQDFTGVGLGNIVLVSNPFIVGTNAELFLDQASACVDTGSDVAADAAFGVAGIDWRTMTTDIIGTLDASPVDMGRHYSP